MVQAMMCQLIGSLPADLVPTDSPVIVGSLLQIACKFKMNDAVPDWPTPVHLVSNQGS